MKPNPITSTPTPGPVQKTRLHEARRARKRHRGQNDAPTGQQQKETSKLHVPLTPQFTWLNELWFT